MNHPYTTKGFDTSPTQAVNYTAKDIAKLKLIEAINNLMAVLSKENKKLDSLVIDGKQITIREATEKEIEAIRLKLGQ